MSSHPGARHAQHFALEFGPAWDPIELRPAVSIIVPALDEAQNIDRTLNEIIRNIRGRCDYEIIVADGGSCDGTVEKVECWDTFAHPVSILRGDGLGGLADDVLSAAALAKYPILVIMDADGSHPASSILDLVRPIANGHSDMVVGSRYVEGGSVVGWPIHRRIASYLGTALAAPFTDAADPLSGFFAIRRERFLAAAQLAEGFKVGLEVLLVGGDDLRVKEVPISFTDRRRGKSKISAGHFVECLRQLERVARGRQSQDEIQRFLVVGIAGFLLDFVVVSGLWAFGADITLAQIGGFCFTTAFSYLGHSRWSFQGRADNGMRFPRFMLSSILALAMRSGFIVAASSALGLPFFWTVICGIVGGGMVSYIGNEFYVFRSNPSLPSSTKWKLAAIAIVAYVVLLRIVYQSGIDLIPQEAYYWNYTQHPALGYLDHPPMVAWLIWAGTAVLGDTEFGVRVGATLCWLATAFFVFRLTDNLFGRTQAFLAVLLLAVLPFFFGIGMLMTPDAPLTAAWAGALHFLERALVGKRNRAWIVAGVCVGLGMLSKYSVALLAPATIVFLIVDLGSRRWFLTRWPYLCAAVAIVLFSPVLAWNASNDWASFEFQGSRRWFAEDIRFSVHMFVLYIAALLGPIGLFLAAAVPGNLARIASALNLRSRTVFVVVFTLVPLSVFLMFSLFHGVKLNWTGPVWLALLPAMANVIATVVRSGNGPRFTSALETATVTGVVLFAVFLHYLALGLPFLGYHGGLRALPVAWEEFSAQAEQIKMKVQTESGYSPLLVGMDTYNIASELGFYSRGRTKLTNIASQNLFGKRGLMFGIWTPKPPSERGIVIMYGLKESSLSPVELSPWFQSLDVVRRQVVRKNGVEVGEFFYTVGYKFRRPQYFSRLGDCSIPFIF